MYLLVLLEEDWEEQEGGCGTSPGTGGGEGRPLLRLESPNISILRHTTGLPVWPSTRIVPNYSTFRQASQDDDSTDSTRNEGHSKHKNVPSDVYIPPLPESLTLSPSVVEPPTTSGAAAAASGNASDASNQAMVPQFDDSVLDDDDYEIHIGTPKTTFIMNKLLPRPPPEPDFDLTKHITH
ncbi:uncharacterized protein [Panulirus ornatus]|uniref:uncharacterized protein n=1 Tax=Panulirus ornatus TaxID=150431 RepID=UPI003A8849CF